MCYEMSDMLMVFLWRERVAVHLQTVKLRLACTTILPLMGAEESDNWESGYVLLSAFF